jgi:hypothetical protein
MIPSETCASTAMAANPNSRSCAALGWWAVLVIAVLLIIDTNPDSGVPRPYDGVAFVVARAAYAMIGARAAFAVLFRNRSWWWTAYGVLLLLVELLVAGVLKSASDGWK